MKPASLSTRLGVSMALLCAGLVVVLALLAYAALDHELQRRAHDGLADKLAQVNHGLAQGLGRRDLAREPHELLDLVAGHDDLALTLLAAEPGGQALLDTGPAERRASLDRLALDATPGFHRWRDAGGRPLLSAGGRVRLADGTPLRVLLTLDRNADEALLGAFRRSVLAGLPLLLLLVGLGGWYAVQRGLSPLQRFRKVAARVSTEDLSHRIPVEKLPLELGEAACALNVMLHRLDNGVQQLTQFSDDLAHELRSPIGNLLGKAQVVLSRERPAEEYQAALASSIEELERLSRIVADMLFLAQVNQAQVPFERVGLDREARRVAELFLYAAEDKGVEIALSGEASVQGNRLMVQRAISNLLSNAIRHTPPGTRIDIAVERDAEGASLVVENAGTGIAEQHLAHLFERFYRVDGGRSRAEGGTGLGLAIVRSIMSLHAGAVTVESRPQGPTRFRLRFPGAA
ncbi:heavy metal sensor histidine kinase [Pseudomonas citronellolis]|uniref:heavy metal sensor histidine kinase n=1 Tax=Pseudomonas citronellolis TaxID=53408 RepID=UPI0023E3F27B|nr:heavy metal sensor histidine kinase [Pseudomonas citronellolis]MDF3933063.1 heavy metal sensor histidine kinase [Pseudomonas citronellolis]